MTSSHGTGAGPETTIRLRDPGDVVATLPYHLGYRPEESLVVIALDGAQVGFVARIDLPPVDLDPWEAAGDIVPAVLRQQPDRVLLVAYEAVPGQSAAFSAAVRGVLLDTGVEVAERLVVRAGRIYTPDCHEGCCPVDGREVPGAADVPAVADYVLLGRAPVGARADLDALVAPDDTAAARLPATELLAAEVVRLCRRTRPTGPRRRGRPARTRVGQADDRAALDALRRRALEEWARFLDDLSTSPAADAATSWDPEASLAPEPAGANGETTDREVLLAATLRDVALRDLVIAWLCPGSLDLDTLDPHLVAVARSVLPTRVPAAGDGVALTARLAALCRVVPAPHAAPALTVLAGVAWWRGDGALTRTALDRALAQEEGYRLALLLERMVDLAIPPRRDRPIGRHTA